MHRGEHVWRRVQEGRPLVLNVVRKAEQALVHDASRNKEYLPIGGNPDVRLKPQFVIRTGASIEQCKGRCALARSDAQY